MKRKILSSFLLLTLLSIAITGCGKNNEGWKDSSTVEIKETEDEVPEGTDLNLTGKLYTEKNKPENSKEIKIYDCKKDILDIEEHTTYAKEEDINIEYLLNIVSAYSANGVIELSGYVIGDTATVNIQSEYNFLNWLQVDYPDKMEEFNPRTQQSSDVRFGAYGFSLNAMNVIDKTLKSNLDVATVAFKINDEYFFKLGENCNIIDGIYFNDLSLPIYLPSTSNYYSGYSFNELVELYTANSTDITEKSEEEQLSLINSYIKTQPLLPAKD